MKMSITTNDMAFPKNSNVFPVKILQRIASARRNPKRAEAGQLICDPCGNNCFSYRNLGKVSSNSYVKACALLKDYNWLGRTTSWL
jgi:hypothetical protein